jgi:uncharacterized protein
MARPKCCRRVGQEPACTMFRPVGVPVSLLDIIVLSVDEFEALRLADLEGLYQEQAAERMNISRQTFGRIVGAARHKVARALADGLVVRIEGGQVEMQAEDAFECDECRHRWELLCKEDGPAACPKCRSTSFHRADRGCDPPTDGGVCRTRPCDTVKE